MYRHETITLAVGIILLAALGWVYWDLSRQVEAGARQVEAVARQVEAVAAAGRDTTERVDRIADAMPNLGVRVAFEEIHRELTGAVSITRPLTSETGDEAVFVRLIDIPRQTETLYRLPLDTDANRTVVLAIKGIITEADPTAVSMDQLDRWTTDVEANMEGEVAFAVLADRIDGASSFVIFKDFGPVTQQFSTLRLEPQSEKVLPIPVKNWTELAIYLSEIGPPKGWDLPDLPGDRMQTVE